MSKSVACFEDLNVAVAVAEEMCCGCPATSAARMMVLLEGPVMTKAAEPKALPSKPGELPPKPQSAALVARTPAERMIGIGLVWVITLLATR